MVGRDAHIFHAFHLCWLHPHHNSVRQVFTDEESEAQKTMVIHSGFQSQPEVEPETEPRMKFKVKAFHTRFGSPHQNNLKDFLGGYEVNL
jgi:hypothetical protein